MHHRSFSSHWSIVFLLLVFSITPASIPRIISYQGVLTDTDGSPLQLSGQNSITFSLYADSTSTTALWSEEKELTLQNGFLATMLGNKTPFPATLDFNAVYYLGISIDGNDELKPRVAFSTVPYAFRAVWADSAQYAKNVPPLAENTISGSHIVDHSLDSADLPEVYKAPEANFADSSEKAKHAVNADTAEYVAGVAANDHSHSNLDAKDGDPENALIVDVNGKVGIATINPTAKLEIYDPSTEGLIISGPGDHLFGIKGYGPNDNDSATFSIRNDANDCVVLNTQNSIPLSLGVNITNGMGSTIRHMTINKDGNVGIGTVVPLAGMKLDVAGNTRINGQLGIGGLTDYLGLSVGDIGIPNGSFIKSRNSDDDSFVNLIGLIQGTDNTILGQVGNIGIGTTSPLSRLSIESLSGSTEHGAYQLELKYPGTVNHWYLGQNADGHFHLATYFGGDISDVFTIKNLGNVGIGTSNPQELLHLKTDNPWGIRWERNGYDIYHVGNIGSGFSVHNLTDERYEMVFAGNGTVGIGTTSPEATLHVVGGEIKVSTPDNSPTGEGGQIQFVGQGEYPRCYIDNFYGHMRLVGEGITLATFRSDGDLEVTGNISCVDLNETSDQRFKTDISSYSSTLQKIDSIQCVSFKWNQVAYPEKHFSDETQIGLIAQDVEKVFPELVHTDNEGYKSLNYSKLSAVLVEAIKEQQKQIDDLKGLLSELKDIKY